MTPEASRIASGSGPAGADAAPMARSRRGPARSAVAARPRFPRLRARHHGRRHDLGVGALPGRGHLQWRRLRRHRLRLDDAGPARRRDRRHRAIARRGPSASTSSRSIPSSRRSSMSASAAASAMSCWRADCRAPPRWRASRRAAPSCSASRRRSSSRGSWCAWAPTPSSSRAWKRAAISARSRPACWRRKSCRRSTTCRSSSPAASAAARRSLAYLEMGAAGVQLGTRFVCAHESIAHPRFKQAFIRAGARDAVPSVAARRALPGDPGARARQ